MKWLYGALVVLLVLIPGLLVVVARDDREVVIESMESKSKSGGPVFNKIRWFQFKNKDVWMMNQSHHGSQAKAGAWDRLAIVVDKTQSPKTARYYQLEPGPLEWKEELGERPFKVSCFMCHNNGPRVIRPNYVSPFSPTSVTERLKVAYWNLRIKAYGRVVASSVHDELDKEMLPPFRFRSAYENEPLKVAACVKCHKDTGFFARGLLRRQHLPTIRFMLESGQMPPLGFSVSNEDKRELERYLEGF